MKKELLNKMTEQFYQDPYDWQTTLKKGASVAFVKYQNQYGLVIDIELAQKRNYRNYYDEYGTPIGLPVFLLFNSIKDIEKLQKQDSIIDTSVYVNEKAQEMFENSKILTLGKAKIDVRYDTFIMRDLTIKQFPKNTVLVIRVDSHNPGTISKTTNEIPARTYFQLKEQRVPQPFSVGGLMKVYAIGFAVLQILITLFITMSLGSMIINQSKRRKDLETKFKSIIKDGKDWNIYVVPEDAPNAFAIIKPNIFITDGLLKMVSDEELIAVMLHEAGHIKNYDVLKTIGSHFSIIGLFLGAMIKIPSWGAVITYLIMNILLSSNFYQFVKSRLLGRPAEYRADSFAAKYGYSDQLISALNKIEVWIKHELEKRPCGELCQKIRKLQEHLDDHPELKDRIESILKTKEAWEAAAKNSFKMFKAVAISIFQKGK